MSKLVLGVGHCSMDSSRIAAVVKAVGGTFENVFDREQAVERVKKNDAAVVMVNRFVGMNKESGLELVKELTADEQVTVPIMMTSSAAEERKEAEAAGAAPSFGKDTLESDESREMLKQYIS